MTAEEQGPVAETARIIVDGHTPDGVHVQINETQGSYMERFRVYLDGKLVTYVSASRRRDGGSTRITTSDGDVIFINKRMGSVPWATFNNERLVGWP